MGVETRNILWGDYQLFDTNILCFDSRKVDETEYVESESENIPFCDAPQGMAQAKFRKFSL